MIAFLRCCIFVMLFFQCRNIRFENKNTHLHLERYTFKISPESKLCLEVMLGPSLTVHSHSVLNAVVGNIELAG